ncbi:MAG: DUF4430 domain-containing protein [Bifidobacteriaceae bacterium]|nr:DUF4430 domain-containing protein [Bifidobacteriaceae bacterium]MCI1978511.1 DUF4430 domain-containing protein [Bifidobacteriaceae bacterium]
MRNLKKIVGIFVSAVLSVGALAGCGTAADATGAAGVTGASAQQSLAKTTKLPSNGVITADQMKTLVGKTGTYSFTGKSGKYAYEWRYQAEQIKNPTEQKLKVTLSEKNLDAVKKAAANAPYALSATIANFELAGSPQLVITVPSKWSANRVVAVAKQNNELRQISSAAPKLSVQKKTTVVTSTVTVTHQTVYFVGGAGSKSDTKASGGKNSADGSHDAGEGSDGAAASAGADGSGTLADGSGAGSSTGSGSSSTGTGSGTSSSTSGASGASGNSSALSGSNATSGSSSGKTAGGSSKSDGTIRVTVSIDAKTLVGHLAEVSANKRAYVPANGWILAPTTVTAKQGESVYDLLVSVTKAHKIQMESSYTPMYGSAYIEGIGQLYEFDAGSASGWMYSVDGWFPNYGASQYTSLHNGSVVKWRYTRELGADIGGGM